MTTRNKMANRMTGAPSGSLGLGLFESLSIANAENTKYSKFSSVSSHELSSPSRVLGCLPQSGRIHMEGWES